MHSHQGLLEPEIQAIWLAAVEDAGLIANECLLYVFGGEQSETGYSGCHFARGSHIYEADHIDADVNALLLEMNVEECVNATRIIVWRDRTIEGLAALIRHELEHAVQDQAHGQRVEGLYHLALQVLGERVGGLPGGGLLYMVIPNELDANAAASMFVRGRYGEERIRELLEDRDKDSAAFRSLVRPAPLATLPERFLAFFITHLDLGESYAERRGFPFRRLIDHEWPGRARSGASSSMRTALLYRASRALNSADC